MNKNEIKKYLDELPTKKQIEVLKKIEEDGETLDNYEAVTFSDDTPVIYWER